MTHDCHEKHPGYHPDQVLYDGCRECEMLSANPHLAIERLDPDSFRHAWQRASSREGDASHAEIPVLNVLYAVQCQVTRYPHVVAAAAVAAEAEWWARRVADAVAKARAAELERIAAEIARHPDCEVASLAGVVRQMRLDPQPPWA